MLSCKFISYIHTYYALFFHIIPIFFKQPKKIKENQEKAKTQNRAITKL